MVKPTQRPLAFVDIETTGGSAEDDHVLEIGVMRVEGGRVVDTFETLLDPLGYVPPIITNVTGITNEDVEHAPQFEAMAPGLSEILDGAIFVAHYAQFDYGFLKREYARIHEQFDPPVVCSVKLSRRLFPQFRGHSLDALIDRHSLNMSSRHRALADADAIWQFYQLLLYEFDLETVDRAMALQLRGK